MEFRLNKIDTEIRAKLKDKLKDGQVHTKEGVTLYTKNQKQKWKENFNQNKGNKENNFKEMLEKDKKTVTIDAYRAENIKVEATKEETNKPLKNTGEYIDVRK